MLAYTAGDGLQAISRAYGIVSERDSAQPRTHVRPRGQASQRRMRQSVLHQAIRRLTGRG